MMDFLTEDSVYNSFILSVVCMSWLIDRLMITILNEICQNLIELLGTMNRKWKIQQSLCQFE